MLYPAFYYKNCSPYGKLILPQPVPQNGIPTYSLGAKIKRECVYQDRLNKHDNYCEGTAVPFC